MGTQKFRRAWRKLLVVLVTTSIFVTGTFGTDTSSKVETFTQHRKTDSSFLESENSSLKHNSSVSKLRSSVEPSSSRGGIGLLLLGYAAKICFYFFTYFKLMCLCLFVSLLFILLCPLIPFLIPAILLIVLVGAALAITIPLISVAAAGGGGTGDGSVTVVTTGGGGGGPGPTPPFQAIPAFFTA